MQAKRARAGGLPSPLSAGVGRHLLESCGSLVGRVFLSVWFVSFLLLVLSLHACLWVCGIRVSLVPMSYRSRILRVSSS